MIVIDSELTKTRITTGLNKRASPPRIRQLPLPWVFLGPTILVIGLLVIWPVLYSLYLSLNEVLIRGGEMTYRWKGFGNYADLFVNPRFVKALGQTAIFSAGHVVLVLIFSLGLATFLHETGRFEKVIQLFVLIPWGLSFVVNAVAWQWIYHGSFGVLNAILKGLGVIEEYRSWLSDPNWALVLLALAGVWKALSFPTLMILAALKGVPEDLMDAAKVDGGGIWVRFRHVTVPSVKPVLTVVMVLQTMWALKTFDIVWTLTKGGPIDKSLLLSVFAYQQTFVYNDYGSGSAAAYVIFGLTLVLTMVYIRMMKLEELN